MSIASWTSPRVSARTLPISRVMRRARSSFRSRRISAARKISSARRGAGTGIGERAHEIGGSSRIPVLEGLARSGGNPLPTDQVQVFTGLGIRGACLALGEALRGSGGGAHEILRAALHRSDGLSNDDEMSFGGVTLRGFYLINIDARDHLRPSAFFRSHSRSPVVPPALALGFWTRIRTSSPLEVKIRTVELAGRWVKWTRFSPGKGSHSADPRKGFGTTATRSRLSAGAVEGWTVTISLESI